MAETACPRCGNKTNELVNLDAALVAKIKEEGNSEALPPQVCSNCFASLAGSVARGSVLMAREKAREQKKLMLWKSRVNLIKKARSCMQDKAFSDAAVAYEKYFRVIEMVFDVEKNALTPEHFKDSARTQELTVVASAYWDLLRIYDTSAKYGERQKAAAAKLAVFLRYTPIHPDIIRKAEIFSRQAKNPEIVKSFLKMSQDQRGRCFVATAAFGSYDAPEVVALRNFRDQYLLEKKWGRVFVDIYYRTSPPLARILDKSESLKRPVRGLLRGLVTFLAHRQ